jgi:hypothetical protein
MAKVPDELCSSRVCTSFFLIFIPARAETTPFKQPAKGSSRDLEAISLGYIFQL